VLVGRSNVGKSSLINALTRQQIARTSAEPGKTRLANVYRITRGGSAPFHLVDLPGYGYARRAKSSGQRAQGREPSEPAFDDIARAAFARQPAALLLVDSRHPGMESDHAAWTWVSGAAAGAAVIATKIDKLTRGERIRALRQLESVYEGPVVPFSATSGEGLEALWKLIVKLSKPRRKNPNA
jgi:GTP-binding protein